MKLTPHHLQPLRRALLVLLGAALLGGLLTMGLAGRLSARWASQRQRQAMEAQANQLGAMASVACSVGNRDLAEQIVRRLAAIPDIERAVLRSRAATLAEAGRAVPALSSRWIYRIIPSPFSRDVQEGVLALAPDLGETARRADRAAKSLRLGSLGLTVLLGLAFAGALRVTLGNPPPSLADQLDRLKADTGVLFQCSLTQDQDEIRQVVWDLDSVLENMTSFRNAIRAAAEQSARNRPGTRGGSAGRDKLSLRP